MSPKTVDTHCSRIKEKMETPGLTGLVAAAAKWTAQQSVALRPD
jgi:DNA-binding CsgD family transcriptional regulator